MWRRANYAGCGLRFRGRRKDCVLGACALLAGAAFGDVWGWCRGVCFGVPFWAVAGCCERCSPAVCCVEVVLEGRDSLALCANPVAEKEMEREKERKRKEKRPTQ